MQSSDNKQNGVSARIMTLPPLVFAVLLYNIAGIFFVDGVEGIVFSFNLFSGSALLIDWGNLSVLFGLLIFFISLLKSSIKNLSSLSRRGYSLMLVIFCFFELLVMSFAATFSFLLLFLLCLLDILCDYLLSRNYISE